MTLSEFIDSHMEQLLNDWEEFARKAQPEGADLDRTQLRDWADGVLKAIAAEMTTPEVDAALERRSKMLRPIEAPRLTEAARVHAMDRLAQGFHIDQVLSEFRALRTSVSLKWLEHAGDDPGSARQLIRFDEALDHVLSESARRYTTSLERTRNLFTAAVGHDLRTPLSSIRNTAEAFLLAPEQLSSHHVEGTLRIRNATDRVLGILQDLLDFTNTRLGGYLPISRQDTDVAALCNDIVDELRAVHPARKVHVSCPPELRARLDSDRIGQLLSNLVSNALKHGRQDAPVTMSVSATDSHVRFRVHNEGDPIPDELRSAIFEPLRRGEKDIDPDALGRSMRQPEGLGLGLYIARQIAEAHGGQLDFSSSADAGTTFEACVQRYDT